MKIIKNINNNFALALDSAGNQLIVSGKGVGYGSVPRELKDITVIDRSYYDVDEMYVSMINDIPEEMILIAGMIVDRARLEIENSISSNIVFTLADHISFCIERYKKNMHVKMPIVEDIRHLFEKETAVGEYGLEIIRKRLKIYLPDEEAVYIALHLINAEEKQHGDKIEDDDVIKDIVTIIENNFDICIDTEDFNYSRFLSHMYYLLKRGKRQEQMQSDNDHLFLVMKESYPKVHICSEAVSDCLADRLNILLTNEEKLYLMMHINRLCSREN